MSCSVCRLPFLPGPLSANPRPHPQGIFSGKQHKYFQYGLGIGHLLFGVVNVVEYFDANMFGCCTNGVPQTLVWESERGTFVMCHTICGALLRRTMKAEEDSLESFSDLCEIEQVIGRPQGGAHAGRFRHVDYESISSGKLKKVDLTPFWMVGDEEGGNMLDFEALKNSDLAWLLNRPDVFPRFRNSIDPDRLATLGPVSDTNDKITNLPLDVLYTLITYLPAPSYVSLTSTCRLLRRQALSDWQPYARTLVLELDWAVPLQSEYALGEKNNLTMAHAEKSPVDADWLLYLSHVHRTQSMRVREWIWGLCQEIKKVYEERKLTSEFASCGTEGKEKSKARKSFERQIYNMAFMFKDMMKAQGQPTR